MNDRAQIINIEERQQFNHINYKYILIAFEGYGQRKLDTKTTSDSRHQKARKNKNEKKKCHFMNIF